MARRIWYHQERYTAAEACLQDLARKLERGWQVAQVRGGERGPYLVAFRLEQAADGHAVVFAPVGATSDAHAAEQAEQTGG